MPKEIVLNVLDLEPPEPFELATGALSKLKQGQYLRMISRRRPRLLYPWLADRGFSEQTKQLEEDLFEIYIWLNVDPDCATAIGDLLKT